MPPRPLFNRSCRSATYCRCDLHELLFCCLNFCPDLFLGTGAAPGDIVGNQREIVSGRQDVAANREQATKLHKGCRYLPAIDGDGEIIFIRIFGKLPDKFDHFSGYPPYVNREDKANGIGLIQGAVIRSCRYRDDIRGLQFQGQKAGRPE